MSSMRDPKSLPEWIELDYYRRPRRLRRWKRWVGWAVLGLASAVFAGLTFWPGSRLIYQAGPVSPAHAMYNHDCNVCHTEPLQPLQRLLHSSEAYRSVPDSACQHCHYAAPHHDHAKITTPLCASCHREHRGQTILARVPDSQCIACHKDAHGEGGAGKFARTITAFHTDHPPFGKWRPEGLKDPGTIRFNHKKHLELKEDSVRESFAPHVKRLREQSCAYCHETPRWHDEGKPQPDSDQRYMMPIRFDRHCASCHPLRAQVADSRDDAQVREAAERFRLTPVPHPAPGETAEKVRAVLRNRFVEFVQGTKILDHPQETGPERKIPGSRRARPVTNEEHEWVNQQVQKAEKGMFENQCTYCHQETTKPTQRSNGLPAYAPPNFRERWLPYSRFDHGSHRMLKCIECHPAAGSERTSDVLLPTIDNCQKCHQPAVGARSDCLTCHFYHDRTRTRGLDGPLTISGSTGREVKKPPDHP